MDHASTESTLSLPAAGASVPSRRIGRLEFAALVLLVVLAIEVVWIVLFVVPLNWKLGQDYVYYRDVGQRFIDSGSYYLPRQLNGPYVVALMVDVLYPPVALLLFVPFAFLPWFLWWAIPIAITGYVLWKLRPAPWAWCVMLILMMYPWSIGSYLFGNTEMWVVAVVAATIRWGWPGVFLVLKPPFLPLALIGIRRRSWWIAAAVLAAISIPMLPLWLDYVTSTLNMSIRSDYAVGGIPLVLVPIVAWISGPDAPKWVGRVGLRIWQSLRPEAA
jgi:hypothetical protein